MKTYYLQQAEMLKNDTRELWIIINRTISQHKNSGSIIPYIIVNGMQICDPAEIANEFGQFYANLGSNLASKITSS